MENREKCHGREDGAVFLILFEQRLISRCLSVVSQVFYYIGKEFLSSLLSKKSSNSEGKAEKRDNKKAKIA